MNIELTNVTRSFGRNRAVDGVSLQAGPGVLGLVVSAITYAGTSPGARSADTAAVAITVAWLLPMTAVCALTLAVAVTARSAAAGASAGVLAWMATVFTSSSASGHFTAAVTDSSTYLPYLAVAACATVAVGYATRPQRGTYEY